MIMKEFILENWPKIAAILITVIASVISTVIIIKKSGGKVKIWDVLTAAILKQIPSFVSIVETKGSGEEKRNKVIKMSLEYAKDELGRALTDEETVAIVSLVSRQIELILAAPQKKELPEKPKSKYRVD